ncbi:MAG: hypothetical protein J0L93_02650 [Deltaproteobacteria bacterium]|nr:hypothetical protein [Deltaproteobacteria bacterium]
MLKNNLNLILVMGALSLLQACSTNPPLSNSRITPKEKISAALPVKAKNLSAYFSGSSINILNPGTNNPSLYGAYAKPECSQYYRLMGMPANSPCIYLDAWKYQGTTPVDSSVPDVKTALEAFNAHPQPGLQKILVMDLKINPWNSDDIPQVNIEHAKPFAALVYALDFQAKKVYVLNPQHLNYSVISDAANTFTSVEAINPRGWFRGAFGSLESSKISSKTSIIQLDRYQGVGNTGTQPPTTPIDLQSGGPLPQIKVLVRPEGYSARMPEFNMMSVITDNNQELIRGATRHGLVNPATGEFSFAHDDLLYPLRDTAMNFDIQRTYRSFNGHVGDFGRNWDASFLMAKEFYEMSDPIHSAQDTFEFLSSGDGRKFFIPENASSPLAAGPFWDANDPHKPNVSASKLFSDNLSGASFEINGRLVSKRDSATTNSVYHLYDGSLRMMMDQIAARNEFSDMQTILTNFKDAENSFADYLATNNASKLEEAQYYASLNLSKSGNFIYFFRNAQGYISGVTDKSGNITLYTYTNDNLTQVKRFVRHNPLGKSSPETALFSLYSYTYSGLSGLSDTWNGLIKTINTYERANAVSSINYASDPKLFGEAPVVTDYQLGTLSQTFSYNFSDQSASSPTLTAKQTQVEDGMGRKYFYTFDDIGFVNKIEGPTETSNRDTLFKAFMDRKLLRVVDVISRGVETINKYNRTTGELTQTLRCADLQAGQATASTKSVAVEDSSGNYESTLACEGASRKTNYFAGQFYTPDFFIDFSAPLIPLKTSIPGSSALSITDEVSENLKSGCLGGLGQVHRYNTGTGEANLDQISGVYCDTTLGADTRGGRWLAMAMINTFSDSIVKQQLSVQYPFTPGSAYGIDTPYPTAYYIDRQPSYTGAGSTLETAFADQSGFFNFLPTLGFDSAHSPLDSQIYDLPNQYSPGLKSLTGKTFKIFAPQGHSLLEFLVSHPVTGNDEALGQVHRFYDERAPFPIETTTLQMAARRFSSDTTSNVFFSSLSDAKYFNPQTGQYSAWSELADEINYAKSAFEDDIQISNQKTLDPLTLKVTQALDPSTGSVMDYLYENTSRKDLLTQIQKKSVAYCNSNDTRCVSQAASTHLVWEITKLTYDSFDQVTNTKTYFPEAVAATVPAIGSRFTSTTNAFRTSFDRGLKSVTKDTTAITGGYIEATENTAWDHAGRVLTSTITRSGGPSGVNLPNITVQYEYSPYGEVKKTTKQTGSLSSVSEVVQDTDTGVVTETRESKSGTNMDAETYISQFSNFDGNRNPRDILDVSRQQLTQKTGTLDRDPVTKIYAPDEYRGNSPFYFFSWTDGAVDGCGNVIVTRKWTDEYNSILSFQATDDNFCLPSQAVSSNLRTTDFVYSGLLNKSISDQTGNPGLGIPFNSTYTVTDHSANPYSIQFNYLQCKKASDSERCDGPGVIYGFSQTATKPIQDANLTGGPTQYELVLQKASAVYASAAGPLHYKEFLPEIGTVVKKDISHSSSFEQIEHAYSNLTGPSGMNQKSEPYSLEESQANAVSVNSSRVASLHPVFGQSYKELQTISHPKYGTDNLTMISTFDDVGRVTGGSRTVNSVERSSSAINQYFKGQSKKTTTAWTKNSQAGTRILENTSFATGANSESSELPGNTSLSFQNPGGVTSTATIATEFDGLGDMYHMTYTDTMPSQVSGIDLTSDQKVIKDLARRITQEEITLQDQISSGGSSSYTVNGISFPRTILSSSNQKLTLNYDYNAYLGHITYGSAQTPIMKVTGNVPGMSGKSFSIYYKGNIGSVDGSLSYIRIQTPATSQFSSGRSLNIPIARIPRMQEPYVGSVDSAAGVVKSNSNIKVWPPAYPIQAGYLQTTGAPNYRTTEFVGGGDRASDRGWVEYADDNYTKQSFTVNSSVSYLDSLTWSGSDVGNILNSSSSSIIYKASDQVANSDQLARYQSCDGTYWGNQKSGSSPLLTHSLLASQSTGDRYDYYNGNGKLMASKRTFYSHPSSSPSTSNEIWTLDVKNNSDHSGLLARSEERIQYQNTTSGSGFETTKTVRVIESARFYGSFPIPSYVGGIEKVPFVEIISDSKLDPNYKTLNPVGAAQQAADLSGTWINVFGPQGPLAALRLETSAGAVCTSSTSGCEWAMYTYVYDARGNVKNFYKCDDSCYPGGFLGNAGGSVNSQYRLPPKQEIRYGAFNNGVLASYTTVFAKETDCLTTNSSTLTTPPQAYCYTTSTPDTAKYFSTMSPEIQPLMARYQAMGGRADILNNIYLRGSDTVYSPFLGKTLDYDDEDDRKCMSSGSVLAQAQIQLNSVRFAGQTNLYYNAFSPSASELKKFADDYNKFVSDGVPWDQDTSWLGQFDGIFGMTSPGGAARWAKQNGYQKQLSFTGVYPQWVAPAQNFAYGVSATAASFALGSVIGGVVGAAGNWASLGRMGGFLGREITAAAAQAPLDAAMYSGFEALEAPDMDE